jgi:hypothetical protein
MRYISACVLLCFASIHLVAGKHLLPAAFKTAQYVSVQTENGDGDSPRVYAPDRAAVADVEDGLREWNRYSLTSNPADADLIFVVHKGRVGGMDGGSIGMGSPLPRGPMGGSAPIGTGMGASNDTLSVYMPGSGGKRANLLWTGNARGGLDGPDLPLLPQLAKAVEDAYPDIPPDPKKKP